MEEYPVKMIRHLCSIALAGALVAGAGAAQAADFEWKLFTPFTANDKPTLLYRDFAADVEKASGGKLKIGVFSSAELPYKNSDALKIVATNQVEMADVAIGPVSGDVPDLNVFVLPFICTSMDQFYKAADAALPVINQRLSEKFGVTGLTMWTMPPQQIWLTKGLDSISELKGRKIRTWNRTQVEMLDLMGASGVAITPAEVIPSLQRGVVDGAITAAIPAYDWKFYEVLGFGYMLNFTMTDQIIAVNSAQLAALPADVAKALTDTAAAWQGRFREAITQAAIDAEKKLQEKGLKLLTPSDADIKQARDITRPMWEAWAEKNGDTAKDLLTKVSSACAG
jgi:TRAP-type C4-dicarboxylate transport system substrate-binding protein